MRVLKSDRNLNGTFKRQHHQWSLKNFNDGFVDVHERFKVYYPKHPRASKLGYVYRSILVYETYHHITVPLGMEIHHSDGNTLNDSIENLILLTNSQHQKEHARLDGNRIAQICEHCGLAFEITAHKLNETDCNRGRFCSQKCYHNHPRSESHLKNISDGLRRAHVKKQVWRNII
jgi:hypothetical protein